MQADSEPAASADVDRLKRWVDLGGSWAVIERRPSWVLVSLRRCDGGEEAERFAREDPRLIAFVAHEPLSG